MNNDIMNEYYDMAGRPNTFNLRDAIRTNSHTQPGRTIEQACVLEESPTCRLVQARVGNGKGKIREGSTSEREAGLSRISPFLFSNFSHFFPHFTLFQL